MFLSERAPQRDTLFQYVHAMDGTDSIIGYDVINDVGLSIMVLVVSQSGPTEEYRVMVADVGWSFATSIVNNLFVTNFAGIDGWFARRMVYREPRDVQDSITNVQCYDPEFMFIRCGSSTTTTNHASWMIQSFRTRDTSLGRWLQDFVDQDIENPEGATNFGSGTGIRSPDGGYRILKHGTVRCADCFVLHNLATDEDEMVVFVRNMGAIIAHHVTEQAIGCDDLWHYLRSKHAIDDCALDPWDAPYSPHRLPVDMYLPTF